MKLAALIIALGITSYIISRYLNQDEKTQDPTQISQSADGSSQSAVGSQNANGGTNSNPTLNFKTTDPRSNNSGNSHFPVSAQGGAENSTDESQPTDPLCPHRAYSFKELAKCPRLSASIREVIRKKNFKLEREDCIISSKTTNFTLGSQFIAWTLVESNSCENKSFPHGLPEEETYQLSDASEINFPNEFDIKQLEKYYLRRVDLKSARDEDGETCRAPKERNRKLVMGSLESELTKAQYRLVDNEYEVTLAMKSFSQNHQGSVCTIRILIKNWKPFLFRDNIFNKSTKPAEIFRP